MHGLTIVTMVTWVYKRLIKYDHMVRWVNISNHGKVRLQEVNKI